MGGNPQDLRRTPPNVGQSGWEGRGAEGQCGTGDGGGAPPPLGGRGTPKEQARAIVARIINLTRGGCPHSDQTPAIPQRLQQTRGVRVQGGRGSRGGRGDGDRRGRGRGIGEINRRHSPPPPLQISHPAKGRPPGQRGRGDSGRGGRGGRGEGQGRRHPTGGPNRGHLCGGGSHPPRGKNGPPRIHPRTCTPAVAGSLWRLPTSQRRVATGRGNSG